LWSKPPKPARQRSSARSPAWPNGERGGLGQILVEAERAGERTGDLRDLEGVGQPSAVVIALVRDEHLRLVGEAAERGRVDDAVAVAAEVAAGEARRLGKAAAAAFCRIGRIRRARAGRRNRHLCLVQLTRAGAALN
jgi:hypothetical protein